MHGVECPGGLAPAGRGLSRPVALQGDPMPPSSATSSTTPAADTRNPPHQPVTAQDAVSAITVSMLGAALVGRAALGHIKRRRERKESDGDKR